MGVQMVPKPAGTSGKLQSSKMVPLLDITLIAPNLTALGYNWRGVVPHVIS